MMIHSHVHATSVEDDKYRYLKIGVCVVSVGIPAVIFRSQTDLSETGGTDLAAKRSAQLIR